MKTDKIALSGVRPTCTYLNSCYHFRSRTKKLRPEDRCRGEAILKKICYPNMKQFNDDYHEIGGFKEILCYPNMKQFNDDYHEIDGFKEICYLI